MVNDEGVIKKENQKCNQIKEIVNTLLHESID